MTGDQSRASRLCLGGNVFGWTADEATSFAILDRYVCAGGNLVDTADDYSFWVEGHDGGESERILGRWMADRGNRDTVMIATKVGSLPSYDNLRPETVRRQLEKSLRNLRSDYVDVYYTRGRDRDTPLQETTGTLTELVAEGKIRWVGVTNVTGPELAEILDATAQAGDVMPSYLSTVYNLVERKGYEASFASLVSGRGLKCLPWSALASGFLTGKYRSLADVEGTPRAPLVSKHIHPRGLAVVDALAEVAAELGSTCAAIALAWLVSRPGVTAVIASARNVEQLDQLLEFTRLSLTSAQLDALGWASDRDVGTPG